MASFLNFDEVIKNDFLLYNSYNQVWTSLIVIFYQGENFKFPILGIRTLFKYIMLIDF